MAALVRATVQDPQNVIDTFGTGALIRLERDTTSAMTGATEVTTIAVVAGTTEYEYRDQSGVAGTSWYRLRYSKASPSVAADYSGYGAVFQAGAPGGQIITLETAKTWTSIPDTEDDGWLPMVVNAINAAILGPSGIGVDLGPSPETVRLYDGSAAHRNGRRLYIPGGIRTFTTVEVSTDGGTTWTAVTNDVRIGPKAYERSPGAPGSYLEFKDPVAITGSYSWFPPGTDNVRITVVAFEGFGWDAYPYDLVQGAAAMLQRALQERQGRGQFVSEADVLRYLNPALIERYRSMYRSVAG